MTKKKHDQLFTPRLIMLFAAIGASLLMARELAYLLWGGWMLLGIASLVLKAAKE